MIVLFLCLLLQAGEPVNHAHHLDVSLVSLYNHQLSYGKRSLEDMPEHEIRERLIFPLGYKVQGSVEPSLDSHFKLVLTYNGDDLDALKNAGFKIIMQRGRTFTGTLPYSRLRDLAALPGIQHITPSKPMKVLPSGKSPSLQTTHLETNEKTASKRANKGGADVIVAFIDSGVDYTHAAFRYPDGSTRIKAILDFSLPGDTDGDGLLDGTGPYGGTLFTEDAINYALTYNTPLGTIDSTGHGTAGLSIAAGSDPNYPGMAPEADLIVVKAIRQTGRLVFESLDIINALSWVDEQAEVYDQPYVANLSLSTIIGSHDGRAQEEVFIDELIGPGKPGKAVVVSAGNAKPYHADLEVYRHFTGKAFAQMEDRLENRHVLTVPDYVPNANAGNDVILLDLWYSGNDKLDISLIPPNSVSSYAAPFGDSINVPTDHGTLLIDNLGHINALNGKRRAIIQISDYGGAPPKAGNWTIKVSGSDIGSNGRYHGWLSDFSLVGDLQPVLTYNADNNYLVGVPGNAFHALTIGSHVAHDAMNFFTTWYDVEGTLHTQMASARVGELSGFSSPGPTVDRRIKPDLIAPGEWTRCATSKDAHPSYSPPSIFRIPMGNGQALLLEDSPGAAYGLSRGTSFAAPVATGIVARVLAKNRHLDAIQLRHILIANSDPKRPVNGQYPWGFGQLNLYNFDQSDPLPSPLRIDFSPVPVGYYGDAYQFVFSASGGTPPYEWSLGKNNEIPGLEVLPSGRLVGTPNQVGTFHATLEVTDQGDQHFSQELVVTIEAEMPLSFVTQHLPVIRPHIEYAFPLESTGGLEPYDYTVEGGSLPPGIHLDQRRLTGASTQVGTYPFTLAVTDRLGDKVLQSFVLQVALEKGGDWRAMGWRAPKISQVIINPDNAEHLFVNIDHSLHTQVMNSLDGGRTWSFLNGANGHLIFKPGSNELWELNSFYNRIDRHNIDDASFESWICNTDVHDRTLKDLQFSHNGTAYLLNFASQCIGQEISVPALLKSEDGGHSFVALSKIPQSGLPKESSLKALSLDSSDTAVISMDDGTIGLSQADPNRIYVITTGVCPESECGESQRRSHLVMSRDGGLSWTSIWESPGSITGLAVSQENPEDVIVYPRGNQAGVNFIMRTTNAGQSWAQHSVAFSDGICMFARSPSKPEVVYAGTNLGLFRSENHGQSWDYLDVKDVSPGFCVESPRTTRQTLAVSATDHNILYVGTFKDGLYRSDDGGNTWVNKSRRLNAKGHAGIAIDPDNPSNLLALPRSNSIYISRNGGGSWVYSGSSFTSESLYPRIIDGSYYFTAGTSVYRSDNYGLEWSQLFTGEPNLSIRGFDVDPFNPSTLLVQLIESMDNSVISRGIWRSTNKGETWDRFEEGIPSPTQRASIFRESPLAYAQDAGHQGVVYVSGHDGIYRSNDGGATWSRYFRTATPCLTVLPAPQNGSRVYTFGYRAIYSYDPETGQTHTFHHGDDFPNSVAVDPSTEDGSVALVGSQKHLYRTEDGGKTWVIKPSIDNQQILSLIYHPSEPDVLYAASHSSGIYFSRDGGDSWTFLSIYTSGADSMVSSFRKNRNNATYVGTLGYGVQRSDDFGKTFYYASHGLTNYNIYALTELNETLYAGTGDGVFKLRESSSEWLPTSLTGTQVRDIVADRHRRLLIVSSGRGVADDHAGFAISEDEGNSFEFLNTGLSSLNLTGLTHQERSGGTRLWVTMDGGSGAAYSDNDAKSWLPISKQGLSTDVINDLAVDPDHDDSIWLATSDGVFRSTNGGINWQKYSAGLAAGINATAILFEPHSKEAYVGLSSSSVGGIYRGANLNGIWSSFSDGLSALTVESLNHDEGQWLSGTTRRTTLFAGTHKGSAFSIQLDVNNGDGPQILTEALPSAVIGDTIDFKLKAETEIIQWQITEGILPPGVRLEPESGNLHGQPAVDGLYHFKVSATDTAQRTGHKELQLRVWPQAAPFITYHGDNQRVCPGQTFHIPITAEGSEPLFYQWMYGNKPLEGATSPVLTIQSARPEHHKATFHCVVSNHNGDVTTDSVMVELINESCPFNPDSNGDGIFNASDVIQALEAWLNGNPTAMEDCNDSGYTDLEDVLCLYLLLKPLPNSEVNQRHLLDINADGQTNTMDAYILMNLWLGYQDSDVYQGGSDSNVGRTVSQELRDYATTFSPIFDIDGDGQILPFSDGLLLMRFFMGYQGDSLTSKAVTNHATRKTAPEIQTYITSLDLSTGAKQ